MPYVSYCQPLSVIITQNNKYKLKYKSIKNITFTLLCIFSLNSYSQNGIDSLKHLISIEKVDTTKVNQIHELYYYLSKINPQQAKLYIDSSLEISEKINYTKGEAGCYFYYGRYYKTVSNYDSSLVSYKKALLVNNKLTGNLQLHNKIQIFNEIASVYKRKAEFDSAVVYFEKALELATQADLLMRRAIILNSLGGLYSEIENFDKAIEYCNKSLEIFKNEYPEEKNTICLLYSNVGNLFVSAEKYDSAFIYLKEAEILNQDIQSEYLWSLIYSGLGYCYTNIEDYDNALKYLNMTLEIAIKTSNVNYEISALSNIGNIYTHQKKFTEAEKYLNDAYNLATEVNENSKLKNILTNLIKLYSEQENYEKAFVFQTEYMNLQDSLLTEDLNSKLANMQIKYETIQKEKTIQEQNFKLKQNRFIFIIGTVIFLLFALIGILLWQRNKHKSTTRILELEQKMLRLQMNPHFIFNVLSSIQTFMIKNDGKNAGIYLSKFARLIRRILEQSRKEFIPIAKEIEILEYYIELQQLRFENKFDYQIDMDENLDDEATNIPPLILQPIVENAIEHGFAKNSGLGSLSIFFKSDNEKIYVTVKNTTNNIANTVQTNEFDFIKEKSVSTSLIKSQLEIFNKKMKRKFDLIMTNISDEQKQIYGMQTEIILPFLTK